MQSVTKLNTVVLVTIRRHVFAVGGLMWQPLSNGRKPSFEAKQLVKKEQCSHFIIHKGSNRMQCGMAAGLATDHHYYSLPLLLIEKLGRDWLGIFDLTSECYLLLGVEGGQVVPGCDALFDDAALVVEQFNNFKALFAWKAFYTPPQLQLGGEALQLEQLLKTIVPRTHQKLTDLYELHRRSKRFIVQFLSSVAAVGVALFFWNRYQIRQQQEAARLEKLQAVQQQEQMLAQEVWRSKPPAYEMLRTCIQLGDHFPLVIGGWQAVGTYCHEQRGAAMYQRIPPNTVKTFLAALPEEYRNHYHFLKNSEGVQIEKPLHISGQRTQEQLQLLATIFSEILSKVQSGLAQGRIEDTSIHKKQSAQFELITHTSPLLLFQDTNLDGVVFDTISSTLNSDGVLIWKITGVVYGKQT